MNNVYKKFSSYLIISLLLTVIGAYIGSFLSYNDNMFFIVLSFILLIAFLFSKGKVKKVLFYIFCLGEGITLSPIMMYYTSTSIFGCLIITFFVTLIFLGIGFKAKNLGYMRSILFSALLALIIYNIVGIFIDLPSLALLGVILFCGYIAFDINMFKNKVSTGFFDYNEDEVLNYVMDMYLDIINLFIYILKTFGDSDD